ncbi:MAG: hypothetical protein WCF04_09715 [Candidatus Nanopelagicales bacterium]
MSWPRADRPTCPVCYCALDLRREPGSPTTRGFAGALRALRDFHALPQPMDNREVAASGLLRSWTCATCHFDWEQASGPLEHAMAISIMGFSASGKSTYIGAIGRGVDRVSGYLGMMPGGGSWPALTPFIVDGEALDQTRLNRDLNALIPKPDLEPTVRLGSPAPARPPVLADTPDPTAWHRVYPIRVRVNLPRYRGASTAILLDTPGEALAPDRDMRDVLNHVPSLANAPVLVYCLDPTQLLGLQDHWAALGLVPDRDAPASLAPWRLSEAATIRTQAVTGASRAHGHLAVVVLKADLIEGLDGFPRRAIEELDLGTMSPESAMRRLTDDSARVKSWLGRVAPGIVSSAEDGFASVSFHVATATGGPPVVDESGRRRYPRVRSRRIFDPMYYFFLNRYLLR